MHPMMEAEWPGLAGESGALGTHDFTCEVRSANKSPGLLSSPEYLARGFLFWREQLLCANTVLDPLGPTLLLALAGG